MKFFVPVVFAVAAVLAATHAKDTLRQGVSLTQNAKAEVEWLGIGPALSFVVNLVAVPYANFVIKRTLSSGLDVCVNTATREVAEEVGSIGTAVVNKATEKATFGWIAPEPPKCTAGHRPAMLKLDPVDLRPEATPKLMDVVKKEECVGWKFGLLEEEASQREERKLLTARHSSTEKWTIHVTECSDCTGCTGCSFGGCSGCSGCSGCRQKAVKVPNPFEGVGKGINELGKGLDEVGKGLSVVGKGIGNGISGAVDIAGEVGKGLGDAIDTAGDIAEDVGKGLAKGAEIAGKGLEKAADFAGDAAEVAGKGLAKGAEIAGKGLVKGAEIAADFAGDAAEVVGKGAVIAGKGLAKGAEMAADFAGDAAEVAGKGLAKGAELAGKGLGKAAEVTGKALHTIGKKIPFVSSFLSGCAGAKITVTGGCDSVAGMSDFKFNHVNFAASGFWNASFHGGVSVEIPKLTMKNCRFSVKEESGLGFDYTASSSTFGPMTVSGQVVIDKANLDKAIEDYCDAGDPDVASQLFARGLRARVADFDYTTPSIHFPWRPTEPTDAISWAGTPTLNMLNNVIIPLIMNPVESMIEDVIKNAVNDAIEDQIGNMSDEQKRKLDVNIGKGGYWTCKVATGIRGVANTLRRWF